jgi:hypothetical protein
MIKGARSAVINPMMSLPIASEYDSFPIILVCSQSHFGHSNRMYCITHYLLNLSLEAEKVYAIASVMPAASKKRVVFIEYLSFPLCSPRQTLGDAEFGEFTPMWCIAFITEALLHV